MELLFICCRTDGLIDPCVDLPDEASERPRIVPIPNGQVDVLVHQAPTDPIRQAVGAVRSGLSGTIQTDHLLAQTTPARPIPERVEHLRKPPGITFSSCHFEQRELFFVRLFC